MIVAGHPELLHKITVIGLERKIDGGAGGI
jgi:hypothetical protein